LATLNSEHFSIGLVQRGVDSVEATGAERAAEKTREASILRLEISRFLSNLLRVLSYEGSNVCNISPISPKQSDRLGLNPEGIALQR
jgi:hypothetical protein